MSRRTAWLLALAAIVTAGILSRSVHTGWPLIDKDLGDALYAAMIYAILRLFSRSRAVPVAAAAIMLAIELFQLTLIPQHLAQSPRLLLHLCGRLLGTHFSFRDLACYSAGIACLWLIDRRP